MKKQSVFLFAALLLLTFFPVSLPAGVCAAALPAKYDLRDQGRSTSVKDQRTANTCWAFSSMASLESNLITRGIAGKDIDLSEAHLAYFTEYGKNHSATSKYAGLDQAFTSNGGTNFYTAAATLARGYGIVTEEVFPYSAFEKGEAAIAPYANEKTMIQSLYELDEAIFVSVNNTAGKYDEAACRSVKELIMKNGAAATKIHFPPYEDWIKIFGSKKPKELKSYYCEEEVADHAVTVVGWDDSFNDYKSEAKPAGPGAWIIKDSNGTDMHDDGYFYVSYYTPSISQFVSYTAKKTSGREIYQYDGVGLGGNLILMPSKVSGANCFTARTDVLIDQFMTFVPEDGSSVNVKISLISSGSGPASGNKLYDKTFKQTYAGYKRIDLGQKLGIPKGAAFSVIVTTKTPAGKYFLPFELQDMEDRLSKPAPIESSQSYICQKNSWKEITHKSFVEDDGDKYRMHNALAKVYGYTGGKKAQKVSVKKSLTIKKGAKTRLNAKRTKGSGKLIYLSSDQKKATVSAKGVVSTKKKGKVKITVYCLPTKNYKSLKKVVTVNIK